MWMGLNHLLREKRISNLLRKQLMYIGDIQTLKRLEIKVGEKCTRHIKAKKKKNQKARSWYHIKQNWTKLCMLLPCGPAIPFLGSYSEETLPTLHNSETTCCY